MPITLTFNGQTYNVALNLNIGLSPPAPKVLKITFTKGSGMTGLDGIVHLTPAPAGVTSRPTTIRITAADGSNATFTTVDYIDPGAIFVCNEGDVIQATPSDVNIVGTSPPGPTAETVAAVTITDVPPAPRVVGFSFTPSAQPKRK